MQQMNRSNNMLDPQVESWFSLLAEVPPRSLEDATRGRASFLARARAFAGAVSESDDRRHTGWINSIREYLIPKEHSTMTITITTILVIFSMILGGTGATVYAAQGTLPEQTLYPVKVLSEDLAIQISRSPASKLDLLLDFADRRVTELGSLVDSGAQLPESLIERLELQLDRAIGLTSEMEGSRMLAALAQVQDRLAKQARYLENLPQDSALLIRARETIRLRLKWAEFGLTDPEQFRRQARERHRFHQLPEAPGSGYGPGPGQPPGSGDGEGPWHRVTGTPDHGDGYGPGSYHTPGGGGYGPGPYLTGTPTPGSGYGPGPGPNPSHTPGSGEGYGPGPYITGTPTPGSGYGPGPGPDPTCTCPNPGDGNGCGSDPLPPGNHEGKGGKD